MKTIDDWNEGGGIWYGRRSLWHSFRIEIQSFLYLMVHMKSKNTRGPFFSKENLKEKKMYVSLRPKPLHFDKTTTTTTKKTGARTHTRYLYCQFSHLYNHNDYVNLLVNTLNMWENSVRTDFWRAIGLISMHLYMLKRCALPLGRCCVQCNRDKCLRSNVFFF